MASAKPARVLISRAGMGDVLFQADVPSAGAAASAATAAAMAIDGHGSGGAAAATEDDADAMDIESATVDPEAVKRKHEFRGKVRRLWALPTGRENIRGTHMLS